MSSVPDSGSMVSPREPVHFLVFSASLRASSLNSQLARLAATTIERHGGTVDLAAMADFDAPSYDQDDQDTDGFPSGAEEFRRRIEASDPFVIASPEYNGSMPGGLKNAIDWVSRYRPQPFHARHGLLLSASPWQVATVACGRCASRSSISARVYFRTCSRLPRRTMRLTAMGRSAMTSSALGSRGTSWRLWTWLKLPSTTRVSERHGLSFSGSSQTWRRSALSSAQGDHQLRGCRRATYRLSPMEGVCTISIS